MHTWTWVTNNKKSLPLWRNKSCTWCITAWYKFYYRESTKNSFQPGAASSFHCIYDVKHVLLNKLLYISLSSCLKYAELWLLFSPPFLDVGHLVSSRNPDHFTNVCLDFSLHCHESLVNVSPVAFCPSGGLCSLQHVWIPNRLPLTGWPTMDFS